MGNSRGANILRTTDTGGMDAIYSGQKLCTRRLHITCVVSILKAQGVVRVIQQRDDAHHW